jgi:NADH-quinone oxidoreductase subunit D
MTAGNTSSTTTSDTSDTSSAPSAPRESLSESLGFSETVIEVGMTHPGIRHAMTAVGGTTSFLVQLDDDRITDLEVDIGLGHRGFEKEVESIPWDRALPYVSRLGHAAGVIAETAYCLALEELIDLDLPDRAIWLRMLVNEIARVTDHFARLGAVMTSIGLRDGELIAQQGEVEAARLLAFATGGGPLAGWVRIGGVAAALPSEFPERWQVARIRLTESVAHFETVGASNPTCQRRLRDVAPLGVDDCHAWGVTGPALRAAGAPKDVRRDHPYLAYGALDFDVPIGETGDDLDRLLVIVEEIRQSLGIVDQCHKLLMSLGPGVVAAEASRSSRFVAHGSVVNGARAESSESLADVLPSLLVPAGEAVSSVETSTGELGFLLVSDGEGLPRRIRARAPSFFHAQAMPLMLRGCRLDDLLPTAALLHLVSAECDR